MVGQTTLRPWALILPPQTSPVSPWARARFEKLLQPLAAPFLLGQAHGTRPEPREGQAAATICVASN